MSTPETSTNAPHDLRLALKRGLRCKCPNCGEGAVFGGYLKVHSECGVCGLDFTPQRADDGPAYVVILLVGHLMGFSLPVIFEVLRDNPLLMACLLSAVAIVLSLVMLPPVKAMFVAFQWAKGMHGFGRVKDRAVTQETRCAEGC
ncbi:DUF983 domain-containing protein [Tropicibacter sp. S64]|uniref:DUF983 domain-containing protein n=1 Tax=Tropicibacter sp. S64 TaxID=3415122 RepID=UPI003C7BFAA3